MKRFLSLAIIMMIAALAFAQTDSAPRELLKLKGKTAISGLKSAQRMTPEKGILKVAKKVDGEYTPIEAQDYSAEYFAEDGDWYCDLHYGSVDFLFDIVTNDPTPLNGTYTLAQMDPTYSVVAYMGQYLYSTYTDATFTVDATGNVEAVVSLANGENYRVTYTKPEIPEITDHQTLDFVGDEAFLVDLTQDAGVFQIGGDNGEQYLTVAFVSDKVPGHYTIDDAYMSYCNYYLTADDYDGVKPFAIDADVTEEGAKVIYSAYNGTEYTFNITFPKEEEPSTEISELVVGQETITLDAATEYTLNAAAILDPSKVVTINGNGATIKVGADGQFVAQKGIVIDNAVVDATDATKNFIEMESDAEKIDASLSTFVDGASKYEGGSQNVFEAEKIIIKNSTLKNLPQALIAGNSQKWAVGDLIIDNSIVNFNTASIGGGNANGAAIALSAFKAINVKNSTIYNSVANTGSYFFRLTNASNAQPVKVWGTGATATVNFEANTLVNALGSKDFANNFVSNGSQVTVTLKNNVFYNVFRMKNKLVGNNTFDKEATPAANLFDHSEDFTLDGGESAIATLVETGIVAPTAETGFELDALGACFGLYAEQKAFGDQRWASYSTKVEVTEISELINGKETLTLNADKEYTLNAAAVADPSKVVTINGNGATIKVGADGQFVAQKGIVIDNAVVDATDATKNFIEMESDAEKIDASLSTFVDGASKYEGGSQNVFEAEKIIIKNSTLKNLPQALIAGNSQKWAVGDLTIDNSIVNFNTASIGGGNANGAAIALSAFKAINVKNSTIYNSVANTGSYFFRLTNASNAQPVKVWGTGATATVNFEANTLVNALGSKDFANNFVSNGSQVTVTLKNNVFYNVFRMKNKLVGNNTFDKEATPAANLFDHSEDFTLDGGESAIATLVETGIVAPTAETGFELDALGACFGLYAEQKAFGDQRWASYSTKVEVTEISELINGKETLTLNADKEYTLNAAAVADPSKVVTINGNGATIKVGADGQFVAQKGIVIDNAVVDATDATKNFIEMESDAEKIDASLSTFVDGASKYEGGSQNVFEAEKIIIKNSTLKNLPQALIAGNSQKWAVGDLTIDNSIVNFNTASIGGGNANGAAIALSAFKAINVKNSTIYNSVANTGSYFFRLTNASNAQPVKVWGTGATATVNFEANTLVNALGSKDFANNFVSNGSQVTVTLKNNVFYNVFRMKNKLVGNNTFDKEATPAANLFDHSEDFTLDGGESAIATLVETGIVAPTAETGFEESALGACLGLYEYYKNNSFGDPRWATYAKENPVAICNVETQSTKTNAVYNLAGQRVNANAKGILIINGKKVLK